MALHSRYTSPKTCPVRTPSQRCAQAFAYDVRFASERALVSIARRAVAKYVRSLAGFDRDALCDIELAVGEALANAVEHGHREGGYICLECESPDHTLEVVIRDDGAGFDLPARADVAPLTERGYGIRIMRSAMDSVAYSDGGSTVKMVKRFSSFPATVSVSV